MSSERQEFEKSYGEFNAESPAPQPEPTRCAVCGWPLAETRNKGCRPGDCSMRPLPEQAYDAERANKEYAAFWGTSFTKKWEQPSQPEPTPPHLPSGLSKWHGYEVKGSFPVPCGTDSTEQPSQPAGAREWFDNNYIDRGPIAGPRNAFEFAEAYAKKERERAQSEPICCPSCGTIFTLEGNELLLGKEAWNTLTALRERADAAERELRHELWMNHGHDGLYGDDGEMQCSRCPADFKREPLDALREKVLVARLKRVDKVESLRTELRETAKNFCNMSRAEAEAQRELREMREALEAFAQVTPRSYYGWRPESEEELRPVFEKAEALLSRKGEGS